MKNYHKIILKNLKQKCNIGISENDMLRHFIELMGEKSFNEKIEHYFRGGYPDSFDVKECEEYEEDFINFHKSMRQTDFFDLKLPDGGSGNIDMLWWNFIQISNVTEKFFRWMFDDEF